MDNLYFTRVEAVIQTFVKRYGVGELVKWLAEYSKVVSQADFNTFHRIQKYTCEVYNIPIADINSNSTDNDYADAKKTISYITYNRTKLQQKHIKMVQGCTTRTIYNHIKDVDFRVKKPKGFKDFIEKYDNIIKKLENYDSNT